MTSYPSLLQAFFQAGVEFIIVGGAAATAHGSARLTQDLDLVYRRTPENIARLATAIAPYDPYLCGAPPGLPFRFDAATIQRGLDCTLTTKLGDIDLLGEITGGGGYEGLLPDSIQLIIFGVKCWCLGLERLIEVKRAAGRPKDFEAIADLEAILEEHSGG
jgi:predicted nucleotidyltransferase